jgi:hypothetical protein
MQPLTASVLIFAKLLNAFTSTPANKPLGKPITHELFLNSFLMESAICVGDPV